jgi:hypothetical protein
MHSIVQESGIRGAIATDTISSMEYMIVIPGNLMITPPIILENPEIGPLLKAAMDILQVNEFVVYIIEIANYIGYLN